MADYRRPTLASLMLLVLGAAFGFAVIRVGHSLAWFPAWFPMRALVWSVVLAYCIGVVVLNVRWAHRAASEAHRPAPPADA